MQRDLVVLSAYRKRENEEPTSLSQLTAAENGLCGLVYLAMFNLAK